MPLLVRIGFLCILGAATATAATADWLLEVTQVERRVEGNSDDECVSSIKIHLGKDRARIDRLARSQVVRLDLGELYVIDHREKTYSRLPIPPRFEDYIEPEARGQLESAAVSSALLKKETALITRTGEKKEIGAWTAERVDVVVHDEHGRTEEEVTLWMARDLAADLTAYKETVRYYSYASDYGMAQWIDEILALEGFSVMEEWIRFKQLGPIQTTRRLESLSEADVDAEIYEPPDEYERVPYYSVQFVGLDEMRTRVQK